MVDQADKDRKRKAVIVTVVFHAIVLIFFLYFGLKEPVPLPEEQGASIEFGWDEAASGDAVADIQETQPQPEQVKNESPEETVQENPAEEVASDDNSDIAVPDAEEKPVTKPKEPKPEPKPIPVEKPKPTVSNQLSNALESLNQPAGGGSQGDKEGEGDQGNPQGTTGNGALGGGSGSWQLDGRSLRSGYGTKIETTKEEGALVLEIWVDKQGNVTRVKPDLTDPRTKSTSQYLWNLATKDVLENFKFNGDPNAGFSQHGKIFYNFKLK